MNAKHWNDSAVSSPTSSLSFSSISDVSLDVSVWLRKLEEEATAATKDLSLWLDLYKAEGANEVEVEELQQEGEVQ